MDRVDEMIDAAVRRARRDNAKAEEARLDIRHRRIAREQAKRIMESPAGKRAVMIDQARREARLRREMEEVARRHAEKRDPRWYTILNGARLTIPLLVTIVLAVVHLGWFWGFIAPGIVSIVGLTLIHLWHRAKHGQRHRDTGRREDR